MAASAWSIKNGIGWGRVDTEHGGRRVQRALCADCCVEIAGPGAGPGRETTANRHERNSTGHVSEDHMLM